MNKHQKLRRNKKPAAKRVAGKAEESPKTPRHPGSAGLPDLADLDSRSGEKMMKAGEASSALRVAPSPYPSAASETDDAGQSGDTQGLSDSANADSESIKELVDEGQDFEAMVVSGVENAPDPDVSSIKTREVPEDDVPPEYRDYREND